MSAARFAAVALGLVVFSSWPAHSQSAAPVEELRLVEEERARVEHLLRRLDARRDAALDVLEEAERAWREARSEEQNARRRAAEAEARHGAWLEEEARLNAERRELAQKLGPRLTLRYRLRDGAGRALLSAPTVGDFLWRRRMLDRILADDLAIAQRLREIEDTARLTRLSAEEERLQLEQAQADAREKAANAEKERSVHRELLATLLGEAGQHRRVISELEKSRRKLLDAIASMPPTPEGLGGFGARKSRLPMPVRGRIEATFGRHVDAKTGVISYRKGIDIRAAAGTVVRAPHPAAVGFAGWFHGFGKLIVLDHGEGYYSLYGHLDDLAVERGERVGAGDPIGTVGETGSLKGAFLYFEVRSGQKALDPLEWLAVP